MRNIGYVSNQDPIKYKIAEDKVRDYHFILDFIFKKIKKLQAKERGLPFNLKLGGKDHNIIFRTPVLTFIGDNEGLDKLCARYSNRIMSKKLCRNCGCTVENSDNPDIKILYNDQEKMKKLIRSNKKLELHALSMYCVPNAMHKLLYCDNIRGIYGATPFDIVHTWQHGWHSYVIIAFFSCKKVLSERTKAKNYYIKMMMTI